MAELRDLIGFRLKGEALFDQPGIRAQIQLFQGISLGKLFPDLVSGVLLCFHKHLLIFVFDPSSV